MQAGGPVAAEPKMHFSPKLLHKGLKSENTDDPEARTDPNGTKKVPHANVPMGYTLLIRNKFFSNPKANTFVEPFSFS